MIATVERAAGRLPPSERDFQVFRFVRVEHNATRAAARVFAVSQTRVRQVVSRVVEYLLAVAREGLEEDEEEQAGSLSVAEQIARMQLEHLYSQAMQSWNDSQRVNGLGQASLGQTRYLSLAARISLLMSKVPMHAPPRLREDIELEGAESWEGEASREGEAHAEPCLGETPPAEDCSLGAASRPIAEADSAPTDAASGEPEATYKTLEEIKAEARRMFLRPAQRETASADSSPEGVKRESSDPLASQHERPPLSRRERRARQRQLERLKEKR